jgi:Skp family chaperone for outer membrane proteins
MRRLRAALAVVLALVAGPVAAQDPSFRLLDQDRLFAQSQFGQRVLAELRQLSAELTDENQSITSALMAEELALTEARATLSPEEFRARADDFDARVEAIRAEQEDKSRELQRRNEAEQLLFFETALPVLLAMMQDLGIEAILDARAVILGNDALDVTDLAIERLDAVLGAGPGQ